MVAENSPSPASSEPPPGDVIALPPTPEPLPEDVSNENPDGDLPDYEELTPELLEDECIRGDAMLRWAVTLLSLLLGWVYITETPVLVSIRSGEYMLSHGILPPRTDIFSATAEGRPWVNLSWLSDLLLGATTSLLGLSALSLLCAVTVGVSWGILSRISLPGVTSWWGSICLLVALVALFPTFQPGASTITILGLALLCACLHRSALVGSDETRWQYIPLFILWANLDSSAWIGMLIFLLFLVGECFTATFRTPLGRKKLLISAGAVLLGALLCPWPFRPLTQAFVSLHAANEARQYQGLSEFFRRLDFRYVDPVFWESMDLFSLAAVSLLICSSISFCLNWKRLHPGWLLAWIGVNSLGFVYGPAICYAAIVNAVVATLNGQSWYRDNFSMSHEITAWNVLWSRAGRAAMVLGIFLLAYLSVNGAFMGPQGRRIGLGLDPRWSERIESLGKHVLPGALTDKIFPTVPAQGDLLIWLGKKPYVDSRLSLYLAGGDNLLKLHRETRSALFPGRDADKTEKLTETWKANLERFQVDDVLVRLWGPLPAYGAFFQIYNSPAWALTGLGSAGAMLSRTDPSDPKLKALLEQNQIVDFSKLAFRPAEPPVVEELQLVWPTPVSRYDRWMVQKLDVIPAGSQLGRHFLTILTESGKPLTAQSASALAILAIRHCRQALQENPNHPLAYRVMGDSYRVIQQMETQVASTTNSRPAVEELGTQILASAYAAAIAGNEDPNDLIKLFQMLVQRRLLDTALAVLNRYETSVARYPILELPKEQRAELEQLRVEIQKAVDDTKGRVEVKKAQGVAVPEQMIMALQNNCPALALSLVETDLTAVSGNPELQLIYMSLLLQNGRVENAVEQVEGLGARLNGPQGAQAPPALKAQWRSIARSVYLAANNLHEFIKLSDESDAPLWNQAASSLIQLPFGSTQLPVQLEIWPAYTARVTLSAAVEVPEQWSLVQFSAARAELQLGNLKQAEKRLQNVLNLFPRFSQRAVAAQYLNSLTGSVFQFPDDAATIPAWVQSFDKDAKLKSSANESDKPADAEKTLDANPEPAKADGDAKMTPPTESPTTKPDDAASPATPAESPKP